MPLSNDDAKQTVQDVRQEAKTNKVPRFYLDLAERPFWEAVYAAAVRGGYFTAAARFADEAVQARRVRT
jgi:hypothetical protein